MKKLNFPIIHVIGLPGAGKTTLAAKLGRKLNLPIYSIGDYRSRLPMTAIGEVDAWVALFHSLSRRGWKNCILETTGLNFREEFLKTALPLSQMITIKLEASRKTLHKRIQLKKKSEQGREWFFSKYLPDKFVFVNRFYKKFAHIPADYCIHTDRRTKFEVFQLALKEINNYWRRQ
ncbi:MAG TPA: AAA family ATPase [Candidatus Omnitrophota bacterium]|nr:AAA family ATPase [Candidatus Omnitrophota bacterium]